MTRNAAKLHFPELDSDFRRVATDLGMLPNISRELQRRTSSFSDRFWYVDPETTEAGYSASLDGAMLQTNHNHLHCGITQWWCLPGDGSHVSFCH